MDTLASAPFVAGVTSTTCPSTVAPLRIFRPFPSGTSCAILPRRICPVLHFSNDSELRRTTGKIVPAGIWFSCKDPAGLPAVCSSSAAGKDENKELFHVNSFLSCACMGAALIIKNAAKRALQPPHENLELDCPPFI